MQCQFPEEQEPLEFVSPVRESGRRGVFIRPLCALLVGVALIGAAAISERLLIGGQTWTEAILVPDGSMPENVAGLLPVAVRTLSAEIHPSVQAMIEAAKSTAEGKALLDALQINRAERVVSVALPSETLEGLLGSGRLPEPGKLEALAGDMADRPGFDLDGTRFEVVGRLRRSVNGLAYAYIVLKESDTQGHFTSASGATSGWIDTEGLKRAADETSYLSGENAPKAVGGYTRSSSWIAVLTIAGLMVVACAGSVIQMRFLRDEAGRVSGSLGPALRELSFRPRMFAGMHVLLYGSFFVMMLVAAEYPIMSLRASGLVRDSFASGDLSYIGNAYASGNILRAAGATLVQNFFVATVLCTLLPSLVIPFVGVFKNVVSFAVVGFVMPPLWSGSASKLVYHCITMTLEMEAYIVASVIVVAFPLSVIKGIASGCGFRALCQSIRVVASAVLLTGIMLTVAALYEAATLILLSPFD